MEVNGHTAHPDAQWFPDAELGLFIHWGISSVHGNIDISWGMFKDYQWSPESIPPKQYFELAKYFNPPEFEPEKIIKAAVDAGFKYAVLTTRHHDGYAMWPSKFGSFNTGIYMNGRDLVGEYVAACRKYGMKVGFYYSPPDFYTFYEYESFRGYNQGDKVDKDASQVELDYNRAIIRGQLSELLSNYGQIDVIWFDGDGLEYMSKDEIRSYQPGIVIGRGPATDFRSTECKMPTEEEYHKELEGYWWECCHELSSRWGYTRDEEYKPVEVVAEWYKTVVEKYHGNLLLNVAPNGRGKLPESAYKCIAEFGDWVKEYKKSKQAE